MQHAPLPLHTHELGRNWIALDEVDSTNAYARQLAREGCPAGTLITAERQTAGRGRRGRTWQNAPGQDICMSLVLRPPLEPQHAPRFTIATALGLHRALDAMGIQASIKWPNDLLLDGRKLSGILLEMECDLTRLAAVIIGIGLNVNTAAFPPELSATSLALHLGQSLDRAAVLGALLDCLEPLYDALTTDAGFSAILSEYRAHCGTLGQAVQVEGIDERFSGIAEDVDAEGRLLVRDSERILRTVSAGDVSIRS